jgi:hypothetical protein
MNMVKISNKNAIGGAQPGNSGVVLKYPYTQLPRMEPKTKFCVSTRKIKKKLIKQPVMIRDIRFKFDDCVELLGGDELCSIPTP